MSRPIRRQDVIDCANSEYSMAETAEELGVSYQRLYRFAKKEKLSQLFRHGNAQMKKLKKSNIARPPGKRIREHKLTTIPPARGGAAEYRVVKPA